MRDVKIKVWYPNLVILLFMPFTVYAQSKFSNLIYFINIINTIYYLVRYYRFYTKLIYNRAVFLFIIFNIFEVISCIINNNLTFGIIYSILYTYVVIGIIIINKSIIVKKLAYLFKIIITLNLIVYIFHDKIFKEINAISLIGNKNDMSVFLIPMVAIILIDYLETKQISSYFFAILGSISIFIGQSSTGIICAFLCLFIVLGYKYININRKILVFAFFILLVLLIFSRVTFLDYIANALNKDITFSNRTLIWEQTIENIMISPILGYGRGAIAATVNIYGNMFQKFNSTHNIFLQVFFEGGLIAGVSFLLLLFNIISLLKVKNKISKVSMYFIIVMFVAGLMESFANHLMLWILLFVIYIVNSNISDK